MAAQKGIGVDQIMLIMQTETIPHEQVMVSIEVYGEEVIPAFNGAEVAQPDTSAGNSKPPPSQFEVRGFSLIS